MHFVYALALCPLVYLIYVWLRIRYSLANKKVLTLGELLREQAKRQKAEPGRATHKKTDPGTMCLWILVVALLGLCGWYVYVMASAPGGHDVFTVKALQLDRYVKPR